MNPVKLRFTMTWTIDADPLWYTPENRTPELMAKLEQNMDTDIAIGIGTEQTDFTFTVVPEQK